jgi:hypothetical protein
MTPRERLRAAWAQLEARQAVVHRVPLDELTDHEANALAYEAEHRLTVIAEGREAGWVPQAS